MQEITTDQFEPLLKQLGIKAKSYRDIRFSALAQTDWPNIEYIAIADRTGDKGILLTEINNKHFAAPYELSRRVIDKQTGRSKPIICDLCYTWQAGSNAGRITFVRQTDQHNLTFLCCADLACSAHVRGTTPAATLSKVHLREDLTVDQRVERLRQRLTRLVQDLQLKSAA